MAAFFVALFCELSFMLMCAYFGVICLAVHTFLYQKDNNPRYAATKKLPYDTQYCAPMLTCSAVVNDAQWICFHMHNKTVLAVAVF